MRPSELDFSNRKELLRFKGEGHTYIIFLAGGGGRGEVGGGGRGVAGSFGPEMSL